MQLACVENDHLPSVLAADDRPTSAEMARAELVSVCQLSAYATRHNGDVVRVKGHLLMAFEASFFFEPGCEGDTWVSFDDKRMKRLSPSARLRFDELREAEHHKLPPDAMGPIDLRLQWLAALTGPAPDNFDSVIKADRHLNSPCLRLRAWICGIGNRQNLLVPNRGVL